jgi:ectoine hydroxylase-related dioxygenase (phytanoyl-CoA dioxygenase family)
MMELENTVESIIAEVNDYGFCVVPNVLTSEEARQFCTIIDKLRTRESKHDDEVLGHSRVLHLVAKHEAFVELMCHPLVMIVCEKYLALDFVCSTWSSNTVLAKTDLTYWHVDHPYWTIEPPYPIKFPLTLHVIWCLDAFSEGNGATKFIPGSHHRPYPPKHNGDYDHEGVTIEAPQGSVIFAHGACWHSTGRNGSDETRTAIFGRYAQSFIVLQEDMKQHIKVVKSSSPLVERLLGARQYSPQKGLPY